MKFLVAILTSSREDLCKICYYSVLKQINHDIDFDIHIIVNSTKKDYIDIIKEKFNRLNVQIIETESNGSPGMGHNSVIKHFKMNHKYDYLILVDGDDFLYPLAFSRLEYYLKYKPDLLFICFHDLIKTTNEETNKTPHKLVNNKYYLNYHINKLTLPCWYTQKGINPFDFNVNKLNTPARPFLFSRKSVYEDIYYDENLKLYDDYIVFIKAFELSQLNRLNVYGMVDTDLYIYNKINDETASVRYNSENRDYENENFQKSICKKYLSIRDWDLKKFKLLSLGQFDNQDEIDIKFKFNDWLAAQLKLETITDGKDNTHLIIEFSNQNNLPHLYNYLNNNE